VRAMLGIISEIIQEIIWEIIMKTCEKITFAELFSTDIRWE
jgi:hypothetical protein